MRIIKIFFAFFFLILHFSCSLKKIDEVHGVSNLREKTKLIEIKKTNKNDIIKIFGPSIVTDKDKKWSYFEIRETKSKIGNRVIYLNDYLEINFNKYGLVSKINYYDLSNQRKIDFAKDEVKSLVIKDTLTRNLLNSMRIRMEQAKNKIK